MTGTSLEVKLESWGVPLGRVRKTEESHDGQGKI